MMKQAQEEAILAVNIGSSTLKFGVYRIQNQEITDVLLTGNISGLESSKEALIKYSFQEKTQEETFSVGATQDPFDIALDQLKIILAQTIQQINIKAVSHRVVHGGSKYTASILVNNLAIEYLKTLEKLAPLHQPHNIKGIQAFAKVFSHIPQVACFDTSFHTSMPLKERNYALPKAITEQGIHKYGFHGLSYQYVSNQLFGLSKASNQKLLMAHLGNGASLCACVNHQSIATTMGFSAVDGLIMGTRCGNLDPGVILYWLENGWTHDQIQNTIYKESGLKGISQLSADMRTLRNSTQQEAQFAIEMFTHKVVREAGALIACMGGLNAIAFTGGIGENDAKLREDVCQKLAFLGLHIDEDANKNSFNTQMRAIHTPDSKIEVWVVPTDEGRVAAMDALKLLQ